jgi:hypothetical protein
MFVGLPDGIAGASRRTGQRPLDKPGARRVGGSCSFAYGPVGGPGLKPAQVCPISVRPDSVNARMSLSR